MTTTAADRVVSLAGVTGTAAALMLLLGAGASAGAVLVDYSGLTSGSAAEHILAERVDTTEGQIANGTADQARDHRQMIRPAIREEDAKKDYHRLADATRVDLVGGIAIPESQGYDSAVAQVAPKAGASRSIDAVAPALKQAAKSIQITQQVIADVTAATAKKMRQRKDDEAAMMALFFAAIDDDD